MNTFNDDHTIGKPPHTQIQSRMFIPDTFSLKMLLSVLILMELRLIIRALYKSGQRYKIKQTAKDLYSAKNIDATRIVLS